MDRRERQKKQRLEDDMLWVQKEEVRVRKEGERLLRVRVLEERLLRVLEGIARELDELEPGLNEKVARVLEQRHELVQGQKLERERGLELELEGELMKRLEREKERMTLMLREEVSDPKRLHPWPLFWQRRVRLERLELELELRREFAIAKALSTEQTWLMVWPDVKRKVGTRRIERLKANGAQQWEIEEEQRICSKASAIVEVKLCRLNLVGDLRRHISALHSRMPSLPSGVVDAIENIEKQIMKSVVNEDEDISNKLSKVYLMFQDHVKDYSKALDRFADKDPGVEVLVEICKDAFLKLIKSFDSKLLEQRANQLQPGVRDHNHPISFILSYRPHVESLETGLQILSRIDVAFPSEERDTLSHKLGITRRDVSRLDEDATKYAGYLTTATVFSWISEYASQIRQEASRIFKVFQKYSASIIKALPFWEFLPYDQHYEEHVNNAVEYLLGRKLSLRCAHFLAAFRCLKDSDCVRAL